MTELLKDEALSIQTVTLKKGALTLRAVNHKLRQQMLSIIDQEGRITVTQLYIKLRLEQSVTSQHLAILRKANFVITQREGKFIYYKVNYKWLNEVHQLCSELIKNPSV